MEQAKANNVYISLAYGRSAPPEKLQHLTSIITAKKVNQLIGCNVDTKVRVVRKTTKEVSVYRGQYINFSFFRLGNLSQSVEVLDITLLNDNETFRMKNWRVSNQRCGEIKIYPISRSRPRRHLL